MKLSVDGDEVFVCVKADEGDLCREADRVDYLVQTHNVPFVGRNTPGECAQLVGHAGAPNFNLKFPQAHPEAFAASRRLLEERCGWQRDGAKAQGLPHGSQSPDPGLFLMGKQVALARTLRSLGHSELVTAHPRRSQRKGEAPAAWDELEYLSPFADFRLELAFRPFFRHHVAPDGHTLTPFMHTDRVRLVRSLVGRHVNLRPLKAMGMVKAQFILHDQGMVDRLMRCWILNLRINTLPCNRGTPIVLLRSYFGETVAIYFARLEFYTRQLRCPALAGLLAEFVGGVEAMTLFR
jgi:anoctamin-10